MKDTNDQTINLGKIIYSRSCMFLVTCASVSVLSGDVPDRRVYFGRVSSSVFVSERRRSGSDRESVPEWTHMGGLQARMPVQEPHHRALALPPSAWPSTPPCSSLTQAHYANSQHPAGGAAPGQREARRSLLTVPVATSLRCYRRSFKKFKYLMFVWTITIGSFIIKHIVKTSLNFLMIHILI